MKKRSIFQTPTTIGGVLAAAIATLCSLAAGAAEFKFASVISDNAVLQRDVEAPVWGFGEPGKKVKVSLNGKAVGEATVGENGRWTVKLPPQKANKKPSTITAEYVGGGAGSSTSLGASQGGAASRRAIMAELEAPPPWERTRLEAPPPCALRRVGCGWLRSAKHRPQR